MREYQGMSRKKNSLASALRNQKALAAASGLSACGVSRILSPDPAQRRTNSHLDTLLKLQAGLKKLTGRNWRIEEIASAISEAGAARPRRVKKPAAAAVPESSGA
jgi:hypothetical protein